MNATMHWMNGIARMYLPEPIFQVKQGIGALKVVASLFRQTNSAELPASFGRKEVSVGEPNVIGRGGARSAA